MLKKTLVALALALFFAAFSFAQNKFEGYNIILDVPETQKTTACAIRYVPAGTTSITISDLNTATPMNVKSCDGSGTTLSRGSSASIATMTANASSYKWCFQGEDKKYRVSFKGDQYSGNVTYDWIATPDEKTLGFYNIKDFGAIGDGRADDTIAIKSALAFIATRNGGTLTFPEGEYIVSSPVTLPSGVVIRGASGMHSNAATNNVVQRNPSRITLTGSNQALFRIGECTDKITIQDIELYGQNTQNTIGIEAVGAYNSSQDFYFERVSFQNFWRGISARGLPITNLQWQFDYIKINHCRFIYNTDTGIYTNTRNSDWKIEGSVFINPQRTATQKADSMRFERVAGVVISDTFGGGYPNAKGGTFIDVLDSSTITVIGSETESMTNSFVYNAENNPNAGDYSYPIAFVNCLWGDPIIFNARRTFVSTGTFYYGGTIKADERLRVYSTGDRFCYDGYILGCVGAAKNNFDKATIIFMTGMPGERAVSSSPTVFGTDVEFNSPVKLPSFMQNALPTGKENGSMVFCANCRRDTTPCASGGTGAPAMVVNNQWSCL